MRVLVRAGVIGLALWSSGLVATAQSSAPPKPAAAADSTDAEVGPDFSANQTFGFGKADILGSDGKRHVAYVPLNSLGFEDLLPFYRRAEDMGKFGNEPLNISVDKVQALQVNELYLEHMVVKGKRLHILAARVAEGPVELFSYTQTKQVPIGGTLTQTTYLVYPKRHWYLRRPGEKLVEVSRRDFVAQLAQYFQDEPTVVAALTSQQLRYRDLLTVVMTYNQLRSQHRAAQP